jgi:hypothetical protein
MAAQQPEALNKHQRRARKLAIGEQRINGAEIWRLVDLSKSSDPRAAARCTGAGAERLALIGNIAL